MAILRYLGAAGLAVLLAGCDNQVMPTPSVEDGADLVEKTDKPLTGAQIKVFLTDSTLVHSGSTRTWFVYIGKDGVLAGTARTLENDSAESATGTWEINEDGALCRQWANDWAGGERNCANVFRKGKKYRFVEQTENGEDGRTVVRTRFPGRVTKF